MGAVREVFVKTSNGYERRQVTLGLYNEKMVEIRSGLSEGEQVVINPRVLLGDSKTRTREGLENTKKGMRERGDKGGGEGYGGPNGSAPGGPNGSASGGFPGAPGGKGGGKGGKKGGGFPGLPPGGAPGL
jgi:hypothetical protein